MRCSEWTSRRLPSNGRLKRPARFGGALPNGQRPQLNLARLQFVRHCFGWPLFPLHHRSGSRAISTGSVPRAEARRRPGGGEPGGLYRAGQPHSSAKKRPGNGFAPAGCDETLKAPPRALSQSEDLRLVYGAGWVRSWFRWRSRRRQGVNGSLIKPKAAKRKASGIRAKENGRGV